LEAVLHNSDIWINCRTNLVICRSKGKKLDLCVELKAFFGINIAMGMMYLPQVSGYWSMNEILATPWLPAIMVSVCFYS